MTSNRLLFVTIELRERVAEALKQEAPGDLAALVTETLWRWFLDADLAAITRRVAALTDQLVHISRHQLDWERNPDERDLLADFTAERFARSVERALLPYRQRALLRDIGLAGDIRRLRDGRFVLLAERQPDTWTAYPLAAMDQPLTLSLREVADSLRCERFIPLPAGTRSPLVRLPNTDLVVALLGPDPTQGSVIVVQGNPDRPGYPVGSSIWVSEQDLAAGVPCAPEAPAV